MGDVKDLCKPRFEAIEAHLKKVRQLESMFDAQGKLNQRVNVDTVQIGLTGSEEEKAKWVGNFCTAIIQETAELRDSVPWKWWSKHQTFDLQNARVEVVDILHFLISVAQVLGMTSQDLFDAYMAKMEVNHKRQDSGYSEKDPNDSKHI